MSEVPLAWSNPADGGTVGGRAGKTRIPEKVTIRRLGQLLVIGIRNEHGIYKL